jgi:hypothetical protein
MKYKKKSVLLIEQLEHRLTPSPVSLTSSATTSSLPYDPQGHGNGASVGAYRTNPANSPTTPITSSPIM